MTTTVTVWNEYRHEQEHDAVAELYPEGIHAALADGFESAGLTVRTATLDEPDHGLTESVLDETDVLTWWGHAAHEEVTDEVADRVVERVLDGMGFVALHSAHVSKPFKRLMGTSCGLKWREAAETERLWVTNPAHPIADGVDEYLELDAAEMYGEHFDVPEPDSLVFTSWFEGGEVFRSGCCWDRGEGSVFYFRPGHETYPVYHDEDVQRVLVNACEWAAPNPDGPDVYRGNHDPLEDIDTGGGRSVH